MRHTLYDSLLVYSTSVSVKLQFSGDFADNTVTSLACFDYTRVPGNLQFSRIFAQFVAMSLLLPSFTV